MKFRHFKLIPSLMIGFIIGGFFVALASFTNHIEWPPPQKDSDFVQACGKLNGKEFNYQNISSLQGQCYVSCGNGCINVANCSEKEVTNYLDDFKSGKLQNKGYKNFDVSQHGLDNAWICSLEPTQDNKIKAFSRFAYD